MADFLKDPTNGLWIAILILFVTFYGPRVIKKMPEPMVELLNRNWFRAFIIFVAVYLAQHNIKVSLVIAVIYLLVNHGLQTNQLYESFLGQYGDIKENFSDCKSANYNGKECTSCITSDPYAAGVALGGEITYKLAQNATIASEIPASLAISKVEEACRSSEACNHTQFVSKSSPKSCMTGCTTAVQAERHLINAAPLVDMESINNHLVNLRNKSKANFDQLVGCTPDVVPRNNSKYDKAERDLKKKAAEKVEGNAACGEILHDKNNWVFKKAPYTKAPSSLICNPGNSSTLPNVNCRDQGEVSTKKSVSFPVSGAMPLYVTDQYVGKNPVTNQMQNVSHTSDSYGCQESLTRPYGTSDKSLPYKWWTDHTISQKQCMHSGQCCGYQGDNLDHQTSNNVCLKLDHDLDHGYCVKMPAGPGTQLHQQNVLKQLVNPRDTKLDGIINKLHDSTLYSYDKNNASSIHLSPHFPIHQPGLGLDKTHPDKSWCGSGKTCSLDWDSTMFDNGSSKGSGPGASYPQHVISDSHNPSAPIGTGCWTYGGDKLPHIIQDLGHTNSIGVVEAVKGQKSKPYHASLFDDLRDTNHSGGHQRDTFVGYAPPVGNCAVYSKPDLDFTGTATYPLNDTNALKNLRGETASREPMYAGELH